MSQKRSSKSLKRKTKQLKKKQTKKPTAAPTPELLQQAIQCHQSGDFEQAATLYQQILSDSPHHSETLHLLGVLKAQTGQAQEAIGLLKQAILIKNDVPEFYNNLANVFMTQEQYQTAIDHYRHALSLAPHYAEAHNNLGNALMHQGELEAATQCYQQAVTLMPEFAEAYNNLAYILIEQGRAQEAVPQLQRALSLKPELIDAHNNLGNAFSEQGEFAQAITCYQQALATEPNYVQAHNNLGYALVQLNRFEEAINCFQKALSLEPNYLDALYNLAQVLKAENRFAEATSYFEAILATQPQNAQMYYELALLFQAQNQSQTAISYLQKLLTHEPQHAEAHIQLGQLLFEQGSIEQALEHYQQGLNQQPDPLAHSQLLLAMHYAPDYQPSAIFQAHKQFNDQYVLPLVESNPPHFNDKRAQRRLKLGYLSSHFRAAQWSQRLSPILAHHQAEHFELYCYDSAHSQSQTPLEHYAHHWVHCAHLDDETLANRIRYDQIDILVDLDGHHLDNRLLVFARKPAPLQISYLGYPYSSGLTTMDYRITDEFVDTEGENAMFNTETLIKMPDSYCCYQPPESAPQVNALPALTQQVITFGVLDCAQQLNTKILTLYAQVLRALPQSRLLLQLQSQPTTVALIQAHLTQLKIDPTRLIIEEPPLEPSLECYHHIDIVLDNYPYHQVLNMCDALWMGVPVITLVGHKQVSRLGLSLLSTVGLADWCAQTPEAYVEIARQFTADYTQLNTLRQQLRENMRNSPLLAHRTFTEHLEMAYRTVWEQWCLT